MTTTAHEPNATLAGTIRAAVERLEKRMCQAGATRESVKKRQATYRVPMERLVPLLRDLVKLEGGRLATVTGIDVRDGTELLYHVTFDAEHFTANLKVLVPRTTDQMVSITPWLPGAEFIEREIHDLLGVDFPGHPNMKRLILCDDWPEGVYPLRRGFRAESVPKPGRSGSPRASSTTPGKPLHASAPKSNGNGKRTLVPIGPFHPLQEEPEFYQLWVEGESVVDLDVRISYNHRGIEELSTRLHTCRRWRRSADARCPSGRSISARSWRSSSEFIRTCCGWGWRGISSGTTRCSCGRGSIASR
jgi:Ni,Fe-hydrogenase III component G